MSVPVPVPVSVSVSVSVAAVRAGLHPFGRLMSAHAPDRFGL